jgi:hypothetical protein
LFPIHSGPVVGNFRIQITVPDGSLPEAFFESLLAGASQVVIDRAFNKTATLATPNQAVDTANRFVLQDHVNALCHGIPIDIHIIYTLCVYTEMFADSEQAESAG